MSEKIYVIRRKITKVTPTPIPDTTFRPPSARRVTQQEPIPTTEYFERLSRVKPQPEEEEIEEIPTYTNAPPEYQEVDFRVTHGLLQRNEYIINKNVKREIERKNAEPVEFNKWQQKMKKKDEDQRKDLIAKRHSDLDKCRKRAKKAKENLIKEQLNNGSQIRSEIRKQLEQTQAEIDAERDEIRRLKREIVDGAPIAVAKMIKKNRDETKQMKEQYRDDLRLIKRQQTIERETRVAQANKVREAAKNHELTNRDRYVSPISITTSHFLADLTDEETEKLRAENLAAQKQKVQDLIEQHRRAKEEKINHMIELLNKETEYRAKQEEEHERARQAKKEMEMKILEEKEKEEAEKMLALEKKLEKKRNARIKEAEEAEEHMKQIQARNRYLAINKKAMKEKAFQAKTDGNLRTAKERQMSQLKTEDRNTQPKKKKIEPELTNLKSLLGI
ncbi:hypothetical protein TVAG_301310 [Trichomonas vaginalis G3]|uniref:Uncharacterized protein n=1 Tax=Trichomonas vaginalis (strain ATCC PRA-98 / G3) TaxID=412133 RepID=A2E5F3_TRIV3|nr:hypothetical protein TVAGG3_0069670 [Trichomonas vaginalis G3]EAY12114.1 hypothetical protein TVAG_301310 [Trichomonas vaginalis G3]KAI5542407.1 hypothetical protein TVAGG3_0069670 [Trichomonas vaginalis G3]|eukprot:XP_001324337.1 hypothetical protein [Trichomonas vaginalis G3]